MQKDTTKLGLEIVRDPAEKPMKLIRERSRDMLKPDEWMEVRDLAVLRKLYDLRMKEALEAVQTSNYSLDSFVDLIDLSHTYAAINRFTNGDVMPAGQEKAKRMGSFGITVLTKLNAKDPRNRIYFENIDEQSTEG